MTNIKHIIVAPPTVPLTITNNPDQPDCFETPLDVAPITYGGEELESIIREEIQSHPEP